MLSRYDDDDFFHPIHQDSMLNSDSFFRNTPPREFNNNDSNQLNTKDQDSSLHTRPAEANGNYLNLNKSNLNNGNNIYQSTIPVRRTDSPQRFVSQATIFPNQFQGSQNQPPTSNSNSTNSPNVGIPIKIQHISTQPHKSDFTGKK